MLMTQFLRKKTTELWLKDAQNNFMFRGQKKTTVACVILEYYRSSLLFPEHSMSLRFLHNILFRRVYQFSDIFYLFLFVGIRCVSKFGVQMYLNFSEFLGVI